MNGERRTSIKKIVLRLESKFPYLYKLDEFISHFAGMVKYVPRYKAALKQRQENLFKSKVMVSCRDCVHSFSIKNFLLFFFCSYFQAALSVCRSCSTERDY